MNPVNENLQISLQGTEVTITLDSSKRLGLSASGKTITVASTHGFQPVTLVSGETLYISLNAFVYPPRKPKGL